MQLILIPLMYLYFFGIGFILCIGIGFILQILALAIEKFPKTTHKS